MRADLLQRFQDRLAVLPGHVASEFPVDRLPDSKLGSLCHASAQGLGQCWQKLGAAAAQGLSNAIDHVFGNVARWGVHAAKCSHAAGGLGSLFSIFRHGRTFLAGRVQPARVGTLTSRRSAPRFRGVLAGAAAGSLSCARVMPGSITTAAAVFFFLPLAAVFFSGCAHQPALTQAEAEATWRDEHDAVGYDASRIAPLWSAEPIPLTTPDLTTGR